MSIRCAIVEDQIMFRALLKDMLVSRCKAEIVFEATTLAELKAKTDLVTGLDILVLDIHLPDGSGLEFLSEMVAKRIETAVLLLSSSSEDLVVHRVTRSFAQGFVHKDDGPEILVTAIEALCAGGSYFSPRFEERRKEMLKAPNSFDKLLSNREQEILAYAGAGYSNEEIAPMIGLSSSTVQAHRRNVMSKLNLHTAQELQAYALKHGFTTVKELRQR